MAVWRKSCTWFRWHLCVDLILYESIKRSMSLRKADVWWMSVCPDGMSLILLSVRRDCHDLLSSNDGVPWPFLISFAAVLA